MNEHETIAGIIAEIRALSNPISDGIIAINGRIIADRLEAAHKREAVTGSNQLREALVKARRFIDSSPLVYIEDDTGTIVRGELCAEIDAALSAPPRNCDLYRTKKEAQEAFLGEACDHPCGNCWVEDINNECGVDWLLAPATEKEGGKDGNE